MSTPWSTASTGELVLMGDLMLSRGVTLLASGGDWARWLLEQGVFGSLVVNQMHASHPMPEESLDTLYAMTQAGGAALAAHSCTAQLSSPASLPEQVKSVCLYAEHLAVATHLLFDLYHPCCVMWGATSKSIAVVPWCSPSPRPESTNGAATNCASCCLNPPGHSLLLESQTSSRDWVRSRWQGGSGPRPEGTSVPPGKRWYK